MYSEELDLPNLSALEDEMSQLVVEDDEESDYMPTPMRREHFGLEALNRNISMLTDGRISPIRFQLTQPLAECTKSTQYYIKRKAAEVITASLNCIAPGQSKELFDLVTVQTARPEDESPGDKVIKELISLYEESNSWYTKMTVLSVFVKHYTKSQLQQMIPGLTIWRIDQTRKHAAVVGAGVSEERQSVVRYRLDGQKLDHFLDFISCLHYIQDVAYGTKKLQMSTGEVLQIPTVVRTVVSSRMVALYQNYCREMEFEPLARSTLFAVLKVSDPVQSACLLYTISCVESYD
ncbi:uncharacterized protein LOC122951609 [Acropora millepora]|uniref:uncharacterized protein LOC122951609 n=1 Tax=Acropora millepora TaxID=45264 RepID=UPI001CF58606|nr:uncharacterized protein LOC122951609 [Acropora millepora]